MNTMGMKASDFALQKERAYPIHDLAHAKDSLTRAAQSGTPQEQAKVRAAVHKRYPQLASQKRDLNPNEVEPKLMKESKTDKKLDEEQNQ